MLGRMTDSISKCSGYEGFEDGASPRIGIVGQESDGEKGGKCGIYARKKERSTLESVTVIGHCAEIVDHARATRASCSCCSLGIGHSPLTLSHVVDQVRTAADS